MQLADYSGRNVLVFTDSAPCSSGNHWGCSVLLQASGSKWRRVAPRLSEYLPFRGTGEDATEGLTCVAMPLVCVAGLRNRMVWEAEPHANLL